MKARIAYILPLLLLAACQKEQENPFDQVVQQDSGVPDVITLPSDNFAWLHHRIFRPSCALSGCHDGNFEPDLRTVGSAYNSLVYHPVIGNDPNGTFEYRVKPGDYQNSYLHERLTVFVPNTSGIMPVGFDEGSDWPTNGATYIQAIRNWIQAGAKDMFGGTPTLGDLQPQSVGLRAFPAGNTSNAYPRAEGAGVRPIAVPPGNVDIWFAFADDNTAPQDLQHNTYRVAQNPLAFPMVPELPFSMGATISGPGFTGGNVPFTHKATLDLSAYAAGTMLFVRAYVSDGQHDGPVEIPNDDTGAPLRDYFTLLITP